MRRLTPSESSLLVVSEFVEPMVVVDDNCKGCSKLDEAMGKAALQYLESGESTTTAVVCSPTTKRPLRCGAVVIDTANSTGQRNPFIVENVGGNSVSGLGVEIVADAIDHGIEPVPLKNFRRNS